MLERADLNLISTESFRDGHKRDVVSVNGKFYVVGSVKCPVNPDDTEAFDEWLFSLDPNTTMMILFGFVPLNETFVMEARWDDIEKEYVPKNECGPHCETGVCNKRVASNTEVGDHDLAYKMLLDHLNA